MDNQGYESGSRDEMLIASVQSEAAAGPTLALGHSSKEIARINADGTTSYDWHAIQDMAVKWGPHCYDFGVNLAKLLAPLQPRDA